MVFLLPQPPKGGKEKANLNDKKIKNFVMNNNKKYTPVLHFSEEEVLRSAFSICIAAAVAIIIHVKVT